MRHLGIKSRSVLEDLWRCKSIKLCISKL